jgi:glycosyltransferase involved in cell wall biosynthesis
LTRPLDVLFISPTVAGYTGGSETVVSQLSRRLKDRVCLTVLSGDPPAGTRVLLDTDGIELLTIPIIGRETKLNRVLGTLLMTSAFKIESYSFFRSLARSGIDLSRYDRIATFYEMDAFLLARRYPSLRARFRHLLPGVSLRRFFRHVPAADVCFFGYRAAPRAERKWGVKVRSLPLGVDAPFFPERPPAYPDGRRLLYIGRLDTSKHVDWLVDFFLTSGLAGRGYRLDVLGSGPLLNHLVREHRGAPGVTFHGRQTQAEVIGMLRQAFLLLHPTHLESFGLAILEAMAAGIPVITHDLPSIRAWANDHVRCATFLEPASWLDEILKFEQPSYWSMVSAANLEFARSFTWDAVAGQVLDIITAGSGAGAAAWDDRQALR